VTASATPENWPQEECGEQSGVPLLPFGAGNGITIHGGFKDQLVIVDVGSKTVLKPPHEVRDCLVHQG
jgi:hypothetical protein